MINAKKTKNAIRSLARVILLLTEEEEQNCSYDFMRRQIQDELEQEATQHEKDIQDVQQYQNDIIRSASDWGDEGSVYNNLCLATAETKRRQKKHHQKIPPTETGITYIPNADSKYMDALMEKIGVSTPEEANITSLADVDPQIQISHDNYLKQSVGIPAASAVRPEHSHHLNDDQFSDEYVKDFVTDPDPDFKNLQ